MDQHLFDALSRSIGASPSHRLALRTLAGALLARASAGGAPGATAAAATDQNREPR